MSIYLTLFLVFLKIGAVSFGGGFGMISLIREETLAHNWLSEDELLDFIAISESTPGPIAVNIATFIGSSQAGIGGAILATIGVVLPAFLLMLLVAIVAAKVLKLPAVQAALEGVKPAVTGLILATGAALALRGLFAIETYQSEFHFDWRALVIAVVLLTCTLLYKLFRKKGLPPIAIILLGGVLGLLLYSLPIN
ncbi:MAG: chromate transporter [Bacilli bacterium]|nr:chromate transporter [Bacilli bacterium]